jgi:hypothetical protein
MGDLGQPRKSSSKQTTTGKTNMTEEREDKDTKKESEKKIMGKAGQNDDAEPVAVSLHDQSAVNIHITNFTGDMVGARGHNTGYHHGPRPQHASGLQHVNNRNTFKVNNINANTNNGDGNTAGSYGPAPVRHLPQHHRVLEIIVAAIVVAPNIPEITIAGVIAAPSLPKIAIMDIDFGISPSLTTITVVTIAGHTTVISRSARATRAKHNRQLHGLHNLLQVQCKGGYGHHN